VDLVGGEVGDESHIAALERNRQDAADLIERGRLAMLEEAEKRPDRGETHIPGRGTVAAVRVELLKERADEVRIELRQRERDRCRAEAGGREGEQRAKGVRIRVARVCGLAPRWR
jgi:hypothetical protein